MEILDWKVSDDQENIRMGAIELRAKVAENVYYKLFDTPQSAQKFLKSNRTFWRKESISKFELAIGKPISGKVIEIGAGTGWCSALLTQKPEVDEVYIMDYDRFSVEALIPHALKSLDAKQEKVRLVVGSYNNMKVEDNSFDYVMSVGAIHHSENLAATFAECFRILKPGGFLLGMEHCNPDSYSVEEQTEDAEAMLSKDRVKKLYGDENMEVKAKDNSDHDYRQCEFLAAIYQAGFNVLPFVFDKDGEAADDSMFANAQPFKGFGTRTYFPYFAKNTSSPVFDNFLLVCYKPIPGQTPDIFKDVSFEGESVKHEQRGGVLSKLFSR